ncbi:sigma-70 family RNA polymerase sigma factor [Aquincola sp. MAHUQ-54]|uniref:Sigma-70 family RNA polymerase sigma factor n=1 Tax=Aquincola agrisoli TaxID=3119538 RepID=A0AAW9QCG0_9BURK
MISMEGVCSSLVARNTSWVRQEAASLARRLPSNVERADLIQAGLIAVAQSAVAFEWEGDHDSEEAREAFVRYARMRVRGAMLDELRGMDVLPRSDRRKVKALEIARDRWIAAHGREPNLSELGEVCGLTVAEVADLQYAAHMAHPRSLSPRADDEAPEHVHEPATAHDEVEARVDTGLVLRHLEKLFAKLPESERRVIDAYLGVGMTPVQLAGSMDLSPSRIAQMYANVCRKIAIHMGHAPVRAADLNGAESSDKFDALMDARDSELSRQPGGTHWAAMLETVLTAPAERFGEASAGEEHIHVGPGTRWG